MIHIGKKAKYSLITFSILLLLFGLSIVVVPFFIDEEALRKHAEEQLSEITGREVTIRSAEASFLMAPKLHMEGIIVRNDSRAITDKMLSIQTLDITFNVWDFIGGEYQANDILLDGVIAEIEQLTANEYNAGFPDDINSIVKANFLTPNITIRNSRLNFVSLDTKTIYEFTDVNGAITGQNGAIDSSLTFKLTDHSLALDLKASSEFTNQGKNIMFNINSMLSYGEETIAYNGTFGRHNGIIKAEGVAGLNLQDPFFWLELMDKKSKEQQLYTVFAGKQALKGNIVLKYAAPSLAFASKDLLLDNKPISIEAAMSFKEKTLFKAKTYISELTTKAEFGDNYTIQQANALFHKFLPIDAKGLFELNIGKLHFGQYASHDITLSGTLADGEFTVNQAIAKMSGDTQILVFGILKSDVNRNIHLDGNIEIIGEDIQAFMEAMNLDEHKLLANHAGAFRAKANLYLSALNSTISELRFQAGKFFVEGGLDYRPRAEINYEASFKISGGKLDSLARYVNPTESNELLESDFDTPKITLPWLDSMKNTYKLTLLFDDYMLYELPGKQSRFIVSIAPDAMSLNSVDMNVGDIKFRGDISIDQSATIPKINGNFYLSHFNITTIVGSSFRKHPVERDNILSVWEDKPLDLNFLKGYGGEFNIEFGKLIHNSFEMENVQIIAKSDEGVWEVDEISADIWNGNVFAKGTMDVTSILAMRFEFKLKNILLHKMLESTVDLTSLRGRMNINGRFDTGGISANNLIDNLSANVVLYGQDIVIKGFDMASLIQALPSVRSNSEVANTVRVALIGGQTTFRAVEGAFYINSGKLKTHGLKLRSKHAIGTMTGEANLITWAMNYAIIFKLPSLAISDFPELTLYFRKSMDDPLLNADTRNLESFMTQRRFNR